jgi:hypothetical protein
MIIYFPLFVKVKHPFRALTLQQKTSFILAISRKYDIILVSRYFMEVTYETMDRISFAIFPALYLLGL